MKAFPGGLAVRICLQCRRHMRRGFDPWVGKIPWRKARQPTPVLPGNPLQNTPVFLPGECHGQRSLAGYHPWGRRESDTTKTTEHARMCSGMYLSHKNQWQNAFTCNWMRQEVITLSEGSQKRTNSSWYPLRLGSKNQHKWTHLQNGNRPTDVGNKLPVMKGENWLGWRDKLGVWD